MNANISRTLSILSLLLVCAVCRGSDSFTQGGLNVYHVLSQPTVQSKSFRFRYPHANVTEGYYRPEPLITERVIDMARVANVEMQGVPVSGVAIEFSKRTTKLVEALRQKPPKNATNRLLLVLAGKPRGEIELSEFERIVKARRELFIPFEVETTDQLEALRRTVRNLSKK